MISVITLIRKSGYFFFYRLGQIRRYILFTVIPHRIQERSLRIKMDLASQRIMYKGYDIAIAVLYPVLIGYLWEHLPELPVRMDIDLVQRDIAAATLTSCPVRNRQAHLALASQLHRAHQHGAEEQIG